MKSGRLTETTIVAVFAATIFGLVCSRPSKEQDAAGQRGATVAAKDSTSHGQIGDIEYYTCTMHPSVREAQPGRCPICGMDLVPVKRVARNDTAGVDLTFAVSPAKQQLAGVTFATVERRAVEKSVRAYGRVDYDETKLAVVNLRVSGWIEKLFADFTGQRVRQGEPLFALYSPDLVSAQSEYLLARKSALRYPGQVTDPELVRTARERLRLWQFTDEQVAELEARGEPQTRVTIFSPVSGYVVEKMAVEGMRVEPGMTLYKIADLSTVWVQAEIYEVDLPLVHVGQDAVVTLSTLGNRQLHGKIANVDPVLNPQTRTARVRVELPNRDGGLKPDMYAMITVRVELGERLAVPKNAVLQTGERDIVFVDRGEGVFEVRFVHTGVRGDEFDEIAHGLEEGERVVTSANFLIDAESNVQGVLRRLEGSETAPTPVHRH
jgi:membrane fusion protein, copper/silver efflux system